MKAFASTLSPALREEDALISKSASPKLTYRQAVDSYFVAGPGQICQVAECSIEQFTAFVQECMATAKNSKICAGALTDLDYGELVDLWYALDTLRVYGATVLLFPSIEEAEQGIQERLSR
jgi:hypothetical protein